MANILCVDDDPIVVALKKKILEDAGHFVVTCLTAQDAIQKLSQTEFDAVVTDWRIGPPLPARREKTTCVASGSHSGCELAGGAVVRRRSSLRASSIAHTSLSPSRCRNTTTDCPSGLSSGDETASLSAALSRQLRRYHDVVIAPDGASALALLDRDPFDVILCDVNMPGLDGPAVHAALARRRSRLADRMIFMTGGLFGDTARAALAAIGAPLLRKPLALSPLLDAIETARGR